MSAPKNPDQIIVKNKYYPRGLTEGDVWKYYQQYKGVILNEVRNRELMFAIMADINIPILKRRTKNSNYFKLTNSNYDTVMTGRTITVYSTMRAYEDLCVVDLDIDKFDKAKIHILQLNEVLKKFPDAEITNIRYTGKTSFHIGVKLTRSYPIDRVKRAVKQYLQNSGIMAQGFTIEHKRTSGIPNIDLSSNKFRGAFITPNSLSILGLRALPLKETEVRTFSQSRARIK